MFKLGIRRRFSAAHQLRGYEGKCENLHGHTYQVEVVVAAERLNDIGLAVDFKELKAVVDRLLENYDHRLLNAVPPFDQQNPSAENLACVIYHDLLSRLPSGIALKEVRVWESEDAWALFQE